MMVMRFDFWFAFWARSAAPLSEITAVSVPCLVMPLTSTLTSRLGAVFVTRVQGSYSGVMGLPLFETAALLDEAGIPRWQVPPRTAPATAGSSPG